MNVFTIVLFAITVVLALILKLIVNSKEFKGKMGESFVKKIMEAHLDENKYYIFNNITIPTVDGTTQIDHIVFSKYGIFVIETKHMKGWILGGVRSKQWTQQFFKQKIKFQNPLNQNYKHIKSLELVLNISSKKMNSIVVFSNPEVELKTKIPNVLYLKNMIEYINSFKDEILTLTEIQNLILKLEKVRYEEGRATDKKHIKHLKEKHG